MNVMLTCAGRRNYLVNFFQAALHDRGYVLAGDASLEAAALQEADKSVLLPLVSDPNYFDRLFDLCQDCQIRLLIPLNDLELPLLARQRDRFLKIGTILVVSSPAVIDTCFDKWATFQFLENHGILAPKTYLSAIEARQAIAQGKLTFPVVIKPRWGSASIGVVDADDEEELELAYQYVRKILNKTILASISATDPDRCVMVQEKIIGQEYGLDIINDLDGNYVTTSIKQKLSMRAGETDRAITVADARLAHIGATIGRATRHIGNLDCDVMIDDRGLYAIELNPRFGGGYLFSHLAGINLPAALIAWADREPVDPNWLKFKPDVMSSKCDRPIVHQRYLHR